MTRPILILALSASSLHAQLANGVFVNGTLGGAYVAPAATYIFEENFEGAGAENGWTNIGSTISFDYNTYASNVLAGSQSCYFDTGTSARSKLYLASGYSTIWIYCKLKVLADTGSNDEPLLVAYNAAGTGPQCYLARRIGGTMKVFNGTSSLTNGPAMSLNTTYHVWMQYVKGSGANSQTAVYWSEDGTKGSAKISLSNGSSTADCQQVGIASGNNMDFTIDTVKASASEIGDNP